MSDRRWDRDEDLDGALASLGAPPAALPETRAAAILARALPPPPSSSNPATGGSFGPYPALGLLALGVGGGLLGGWLLWGQPQVERVSSSPREGSPQYEAGGRPLNRVSSALTSPPPPASPSLPDNGGRFTASPSLRAAALKKWAPSPRSKNSGGDAHSSTPFSLVLPVETGQASAPDSLPPSSPEPSASKAVPSSVPVPSTSPSLLAPPLLAPATRSVKTAPRTGNGSWLFRLEGGAMGGLAAWQNLAPPVGFTVQGGVARLGPSTGMGRPWASLDLDLGLLPSTEDLADHFSAGLTLLGGVAFGSGPVRLDLGWAVAGRLLGGNSSSASEEAGDDDTLSQQDFQYAAGGDDDDEGDDDEGDDDEGDDDGAEDSQTGDTESLQQVTRGMYLGTGPSLGLTLSSQSGVALRLRATLLVVPLRENEGDPLSLLPWYSLTAGVEIPIGGSKKP